jgi:hypothetical protein
MAAAYDPAGAPEAFIIETSFAMSVNVIDPTPLSLSVKTLIAKG